jgi:MYXO-CTERM domain-containing protein
VGNFNDDTTVDGLDYNAWSLNYLAGCSSGAEVPEPAVLSLLAVASLALIRRKRR